MRAVFYIRMSTAEQDDSPEVQRDRSTAFALSKGWVVSAQPAYQDDGKSRAEFVKRPGLLRLLNDARRKPRPFDAVIMRDDDRLGGDMYRTGMVLTDLTDAGVEVWYYASGMRVRMEDPTSKFMQAAKGFASELERAKISERTRESAEHKAQHLQHTGGACFGYRIVEEAGAKRYDIDEGQAAIVREIFERFAAGERMRDIVRSLNSRKVPSPRAGKKGTGSWGPPCVWEMIRRERYRGVIVWGRFHKTYKAGTKVRIETPKSDWMRKQDHRLQIVSDELWEAVQAQMARTRRVQGKAGERGAVPRHILSGICRCARCGGPVQGYANRTGSGFNPVYVCAYQRSRSACGVILRASVDEVDEALIACIKKTVLNEKVISLALANLRELLSDRAEDSGEEIVLLEGQIKKLQGDLDRLGEAIATGNGKGAPATLVRMMAEREEDVARLQARIAILRTSPSALDLEMRKVEQRARRRLTELRAMAIREPTHARKLLGAILTGPLVMTAVDPQNGRKVRIEGTANLGGLLDVPFESVPNEI